MERERLRGREKREGCPQWFWFNQGRPLFDRGQALAFGRSRLSLLTSHDNSSPTLSSFISLTTTTHNNDRPSVLTIQFGMSTNKNKDGKNNTACQVQGKTAHCS